MIRHTVAATCCEQWLFSVGESNLKNGFHSSKVDREEETTA